MEIAARAKFLRITQDLKPNQVAKKARLSVTAYKEFEEGEMELSIRDYFQISEVFGVSPRYLILGDQNSKQIQNSNQWRG